MKKPFIRIIALGLAGCLTAVRPGSLVPSPDSKHGCYRQSLIAGRETRDSRLTDFDEQALSLPSMQMHDASMIDSQAATEAAVHRIVSAEEVRAGIALSREINKLVEMFIRSKRYGQTGLHPAMEDYRLEFSILQAIGLFDGILLSILGGCDLFSFEFLPGWVLDFRDYPKQAMLDVFGNAFYRHRNVDHSAVVASNFLGTIKANLEETAEIAQKVQQLPETVNIFFLKHVEEWFRTYWACNKRGYHCSGFDSGEIYYDPEIWRSAGARYQEVLTRFVEEIVGPRAIIITMQSQEKGTRNVLDNLDFVDVLPSILPTTVKDQIQHLSKYEIAIPVPDYGSGRNFKIAFGGHTVRVFVRKSELATWMRRIMDRLIAQDPDLSALKNARAPLAAG